MSVLSVMNPQISQILVRSHAKQQIKGETQSFFVGCAARTTTVKIAINDVPVRSGTHSLKLRTLTLKFHTPALSAPYTFTTNNAFGALSQGYLC